MVKRYRYVPYFVASAIMIVIFDQLTKYIIRTTQWNWKSSILYIHYSTNTGAAFSILQQQAPWLALISLLVALGIIFFYKEIPHEKTTQILMGLFLGGVLGNLIDRVAYGYVIDFIDFRFWPSFNVADSAISIAAVGLIAWHWKK